MEQEIRHRRLHAFYQSKVLNGLMVFIVVCLLMSMAYDFALFPLICGGVGLLLFVGYSLRLWICKPQAIVTNNLVSNINGLYTLYYLVIIAFDTVYRWWYLVPALLSIGVLMVCLCGYKDTRFTIMTKK
ncbi:MAG: hypothetical protein K2K79_09010 [Paramuribaculum sp.]|nr:hypothetical protein [Paramuribaculum sp.]